MWITVNVYGTVDKLPFIESGSTLIKWVATGMGEAPITVR